MRERQLDKRYAQIKERLAIAGLTFCFTESEYSKHRRDKKFPVICNNCGCKYLSSIANNHYNKCPICSGTNAYSSDTLNIKCDSYAATEGLKVLEYPKTLKSEATVECLSCHTKFKTVLRKENTGKCPKCYHTLSKTTIWNRFIVYAEANDIEILFNENDITVARGKDGKAIYYPVRCKKCGTEFKSLFVKSTVPTCPKCFKGKQRSHLEEEISEWLESKGVEVYRNYRKTCKSESSRNYEVDVFLPKYSIGIEFNGYYWHSFPRKSKMYHSEKIEALLSIGIKCYSFWEDCPTGLIKSIIGAKLGILKKVYARTCCVDDQECHEFFDRNHVDGDCRGFKTFRLLKDGECVAAIKLRKHKEGAEIARFACKRGVSVVGGYSKLLSKSITFLKSQGYKRLVSYCNRDLSPDCNDNFYASRGFEFVGDSGPIMKYFVPKNLEFVDKGVYPRQKFQKHLLLKYSDKLNYTGSEVDLAISLNILPVYNSGNFKYTLTL